MRLQDEKKRKLAQELERARIDSLKTRKAYERDLEGYTLKLQKYEEQSISNGEIKVELEISLQEYLSKVDTLRIELRQNKEINQELKETLTESSSQVESLERLKQELITSLQANSVECKESLQEKCETLERLEAQIVALRQNHNEEVGHWSKKAKECKDELKQINHKLDISVSRQSLLAKESEQLADKLQAERRDNASFQQEKSECTDLTAKLDKKTKDEKALRREVVHKKQTIAILQSNEKHLEEHVSSLEDQIDKLVSEYESRLQVDTIGHC